MRGLPHAPAARGRQPDRGRRRRAHARLPARGQVRRRQRRCRTTTGSTQAPSPSPTRAGSSRRAGTPTSSTAASRRAAGGGIWLQCWLFFFHSAKGLPGRLGRRRAARRRPAPGRLGARPARDPGAAARRNPQPRPDVAVFAAHDYAHSIAWDEVDREPDGGWDIYVGRASHASFPKAGRWKGKKHGPFSFDVLDDVADGAGAERVPGSRRSGSASRPGSAGPGSGAARSPSRRRRRQPARTVAAARRGATRTGSPRTRCRGSAATCRPSELEAMVGRGGAARRERGARGP